MATNAEFKLLQAWFKKLGLNKYKSITKNQLNQLKEFDLRNVKIDDLTLLQHIPQMKKLFLQGSSLPKDVTPLLACGDDLERIYLNNSNVTDEQLIVIGQLKKLNRLDLTNTLVTTLTPLENHPTLETLHVTGSKVTHLPELPMLKVLHAKNIKIDNIDKLNKITPNLERNDYTF